MSAKLEFQKVVRDYYEAYGRDLPWRHPEVDGSFDAYKILVSEFMLQQTQVSRVTPKYEEFLRLFPDVQSLAGTSLGEVLKVWSGLGYNRRAKYLWQSANVLVSKISTPSHLSLRQDELRAAVPDISGISRGVPERYEAGGHELAGAADRGSDLRKQRGGGTRPWTYQDLVACPGIGPNTAGAVLAYAYNQPVVFVETNIRTVFIQHFLAEQTAVSDPQILKLVAQTLDHQQPRLWYWALMDYGSYLKATVGNAGRLSKTYTKQSKFEGSNRQIRGQIIQLLIIKHQSKAELANVIPDKRLETVLGNLVSEGLIAYQSDQYHLA